MVLTNNCYTQISGAFEGFCGKEKSMIALTVDTKINDLVHFGGIAKTGSLAVFHYPDSRYEYTEEDIFPYGQINILFQERSSKTRGWSIGGYFSLNKSLSRLDRDWFFLRFDVEHWRLQVNSLSKTLLEELISPTETQVETITVQEEYAYNAISFATRAGYQRFFDKKKRIFGQLNLGVGYYHPYYPNSNSSNYDKEAPFIGVELEVGAGIGYIIKKK
jgi:hypothetical protein